MTTSTDAEGRGAAGGKSDSAGTTGTTGIGAGTRGAGAGAATEALLNKP